MLQMGGLCIEKQTGRICFHCMSMSPSGRSFYDVHTVCVNCVHTTGIVTLSRVTKLFICALADIALLTEVPWVPSSKRRSQQDCSNHVPSFLLLTMLFRRALMADHDSEEKCMIWVDLHMNWKMPCVCTPSCNFNSTILWSRQSEAHVMLPGETLVKSALRYNSITVETMCPYADTLPYLCLMTPGYKPLLAVDRWQRYE